MLTSRVTFDSPYYDFSPSSESDKNEGEAQLVELSIEKPGAILTRVRVPGAAMDFFTLFFLLRDNFQCRLSYGVRTAPVCNHMHQHLCTRYKSHT